MIVAAVNLACASMMLVSAEMAVAEPLYRCVIRKVHSESEDVVAANKLSASQKLSKMEVPKTIIVDYSYEKKSANISFNGNDWEKVALKKNCVFLEAGDVLREKIGRLPQEKDMCLFDQGRLMSQAYSFPRTDAVLDIFFVAQKGFPTPSNHQTIGASLSRFVYESNDPLVDYAMQDISYSCVPLARRDAK